MKEHYVSYDCAVKIKELGFDWKVLAVWHFDGEERNFIPDYGVTFWHPQDIPHWNTSRMWGEHIYSAPRLDQAQAWLREVKGIIVWVSPEFYEGDALEDVRWYFYAQPLQDLRKQLGGKFNCGYYSTYESALSAGIDAALELLTNNH